MGGGWGGSVCPRIGGWGEGGGGRGGVWEDELNVVDVGGIGLGFGLPGFGLLGCGLGCGMG